MSGSTSRQPAASQSRRAFIASSIRTMLAAILTLVGLVLGWRALGPDAARCQVQPLCDQCRLLKKCGKPQALAFLGRKG